MSYNSLDPSLQMAMSQVPMNYPQGQTQQARQQAPISFQAEPQASSSHGEKSSSIFNLTNLVLAGGVVAAIAGHKTYKVGKAVAAASKEGGVLAGQTSNISKGKLFLQNCNPFNWFGNGAAAESLTKGGYSKVEGSEHVFRSAAGDTIVLNGRKALSPKTGEVDEAAAKIIKPEKAPDKPAEAKAPEAPKTEPAPEKVETKAPPVEVTKEAKISELEAKLKQAQEAVDKETGKAKEEAQATVAHYTEELKKLKNPVPEQLELDLTGKKKA